MTLEEMLSREDIPADVRSTPAQHLTAHRPAAELLDLAPCIMVGLDREGRVVLFNQQASRVLGCPQRDAMGQDWFATFVPADRREQLRSAFQEVMDGQLRELEPRETENVTVSGSVRVIRWSSTVLVDGTGKVTGTLSSGDDVTEQRAADRDIRQTFERAMAVMDNTEDAILLCDQRARPILFNARYARTLKELLGLEMRPGLQPHTLLPPDRAAIWADWHRRVLGGESFVEEYVHQGPGIPARVFEVAYTPVVSEGAVTSFVEVTRDITERRRADEALRANEQRYRRITEAVSDYTYTVRVEHGRAVETRHGEGCATVTGYGSEQYAADPFLWFRMVLPEDRHLVEEQARRALAGEEPPPIEHRIVRKDGAIRWIRNAVVLNHGSDGVLLSYDGVVSDVTERRRAQEALFTSEERYRSLVDQSSVGIGISRGDRIIFGNPALLRMFGYEDLAEFAAISLLEHVAPASRARIVELQRKRDQGRPIVEEFEYDILRRDGQVRTLSASSSWFRWDGKEYTQTTFHDVTERKRAEAALRESELRYRQLFEMESDALFLVDSSTGCILEANQAASEIYGYSGEHWRSLRNTDVSAEPQATRRAVTEGQTQIPVRWHRKKDGTVFPVEITARHLSLGGRQVHIAAMRDISRRLQAEEALRTREERFRALVETTEEWIWAIDLAGRHTYSNPGVHRMLGYSPEEILSRETWALLHPEDRARVDALVHEKSAAGQGWSGLELRWRHKDGSYRFLESNAVPILDAEGRLIGYQGADRDVTQRKLAEEALRASEERLRSWIEQTSDAVFCYEYDPAIPIDLPVEEQVRRLHDGVLADCNLVCARAYGADDTAAVIGQRLTDLFGTAPRSLDRLFRNVVEGGYRVVDAEGVETLPDGSTRYFLNNAHGVVEEGRLLRVWGTYRDVTDRRRAEEALRQQRELTEAAIDAQVDTFFVFEVATGKPILWNRMFREVSGYSDEEIAARRAPQDWSDPDDMGRLMAAIEHIQRDGHARVESQFITRAGTRVPTEYFASSFGGERGQGQYIIAVGRDISERRRYEEERQRLEAQVQHAQKLESLGVLAGGIAHDFNNLLVAILGNASLAATELPPDAATYRQLLEIETAARRASELCNQLLAYSGRGAFIVEPLDLNQLIREMLTLVRVSISKQAGLRLELAEGTLGIQADATQLRQIVLNLVINASEAIGETSGTITVSTGTLHVPSTRQAGALPGRELPEGGYVYLDVADTGAGMDAETQRRLFEPFFTTKFAGRGLGLSAVLGIVRGHRGDIQVTSQLGQGTSFRVLFPMLTEVAARSRAQPPLPGTESGKAAGTVLVVDDDDSVRSVARRILERSGYSVLLAEDGREGVRVFFEHQTEIVLVLLDLTMPQLSGTEALRQIRARCTDVPVVLMSGYGETETAEYLADQTAMGFVQKPFDVAGLRRAVQAALGHGTLAARGVEHHDGSSPRSST
jgi:two-component system cell cycle sensor histidine kinase/response regulator CckA